MQKMCLCCGLFSFICPIMLEQAWPGCVLSSPILHYCLPLSSQSSTQTSLYFVNVVIGYCQTRKRQRQIQIHVRHGKDKNKMQIQIKTRITGTQPSLYFINVVIGYCQTKTNTNTYKTWKRQNQMQIQKNNEDYQNSAESVLYQRRHWLLSDKYRHMKDKHEL